MPRRSLPAAASLAVVLALSACSSGDPVDDRPDAAPSSPTTRTGPAEPTTLPPGEGTGTVDATALAWEAALARFIDSSVSPVRRASRIDGGDDLRAVVRQFDKRLTGLEVTFDVTAVQVDGADGVATVAVTTGGRRSDGVLVQFARVEGTWLLARRGACGLTEDAGVLCP